MQRNKNPLVIQKELTACIQGAWGGGLAKKLFAFLSKSVSALEYHSPLSLLWFAHAHYISLQQYLERTIRNNRVLNIRLKCFSLLHIHLEEPQNTREKYKNSEKVHKIPEVRRAKWMWAYISMGWLIYFRHQCESKFQLYLLDQTPNTIVFILWPWQIAWVYLLWKAGKL